MNRRTSSFCSVRHWLCSDAPLLGEKEGNAACYKVFLGGLPAKRIFSFLFWPDNSTTLTPGLGRWWVHYGTIERYIHYNPMTG